MTSVAGVVFTMAAPARPSEERISVHSYSRKSVALILIDGTRVTGWRAQGGLPCREAREPALVDDRHRSCSPVDHTVNSESSQLSAHHLANGANGVSQSLVADVHDPTSIRTVHRHLLKVGRNTYCDRLPACISNGAQRLRCHTGHVLREPPWQLRIMCRRGSELVEGQHPQRRVGDRLRIPLVGAGKVGRKPDEVTGTRVANRQLSTQRCRDVHANNTAAQQRDLRLLTRSEGERARADAPRLNANP